MNNRQNMAKVKAIEQKNKQRLFAVNPNERGVDFYGT